MSKTKTLAREWIDSGSTPDVLEMAVRKGAEDHAVDELDNLLEVAERDPVWQEIRELVEHHGYDEARDAMAEALAEALADYGERIEIADLAETLASQAVEVAKESGREPRTGHAAIERWRAEAGEAGDGELLTTIAALEAADRMDALVAAYDAAVAKAQD
jgi:hypothetical protein